MRVRDEILAVRALVLPSFSLPIVIKEAMTLRRPVISTFAAGIPELVHPAGQLAGAGEGRRGFGPRHADLPRCTR